MQSGAKISKSWCSSYVSKCFHVIGIFWCCNKNSNWHTLLSRNIERQQQLSARANLLKHYPMLIRDLELPKTPTNLELSNKKVKRRKKSENYTLASNLDWVFLFSKSWKERKNNFLIINYIYKNLKEMSKLQLLTLSNISA